MDEDPRIDDVRRRLAQQAADLTLDEVCVLLRDRGIVASRTALWRFFDRRRISFKKCMVRPRSASAIGLRAVGSASMYPASGWS